MIIVKGGYFINLIDLKEEWIHRYLSTRHYTAPCSLTYTLHLSQLKNEAHSWQKMVNSTNRLRQPHSKHRGNAAAETLPQCIKHGFSHPACTPGKLHPWAEVGHHLCSADRDDDKLSRTLDISISPGSFLLAETWSSLKQKEKRTALGWEIWLKTHGNQAHWNSFCFSSPWQHLSDTLTAYFYLHTDLISVVRIGLHSSNKSSADMTTLIKPKESNK